MLPDELGDHRGLAGTGRPLKHTEVTGFDAFEDGFLLGVIELQDGGLVELLEFRSLFNFGILIAEDGLRL